MTPCKLSEAPLETWRCAEHGVLWPQSGGATPACCPVFYAGLLNDKHRMQVLKEISDRQELCWQPSYAALASYELEVRHRIKGLNVKKTAIALSAPIAVPPNMEGTIDQLVERMSRRTGESPAQVRRAVELAILQRGIAALRGELSP